MYLTSHTSAGILIGAAVQNPVLAFAGGLVSHFFLDSIPHEDEDDLIHEYPKYIKGKDPTVRRRSIISTIDLAIVFLLVFTAWIISSYGQSQQMLFITFMYGIAGGIFPDFILLFTFRYDNRALRWYFRFHNRFHFIISDISIPRKISIIYQLAMSLIFVYAAYRIVN